MTKNEIQEAIQKLLENVPEETLKGVFDLLEQLQDKPESLLTADRLRQILSEDKELLEKLAQ